MKMVEIKKSFPVFNYDELSEKAKWKVRNWYEEEFRNFGIKDWTREMNDTLSEKFSNSDLHVQWSLCGLQGDGVNIYGTLNLTDALEVVKGKLGLSPKEIKALEFYTREIKSNSLKENRFYSYCLIDSETIYGELTDSLEWDCIRDIQYKALKEFAREISGYLRGLCMDWESEGWEFLCLTSEEEVREDCYDNHWYFTEDGSFYGGFEE